MLSGRRRLKFSYGVGRVEVEGFVGEHRCVREFLGKLRGSSRRSYGYDLCRFFKWLRVVKGLRLSPQGFLDEHLRRRRSLKTADRQWARSLVVEYVRDNPDSAGLSASRKRFVYAVIKSFCDYYEAPLTSGQGVLGKLEKRKYRQKQMTVAVTKKVLASVNQRDRTILLVMLQSGMSIGDVLNKFNYMLDYVRGCMTADCQRIRVDIAGRKGNGLNYFTFISRDGVHELKKWLALRRKWLQGKPSSHAIFVTRTGNVLTVPLFEVLYNRRLRRAGLKDGPFSLRTHMFRKLFKTEASIPERGVDRDIVEFLMGHLSGIESVGGVYDKTPEIHEAVIEREYMKLEPYINVYSGKAAGPEGLDISQEDLESLKLLLQMFKQGKVKISL